MDTTLKKKTLIQYIMITYCKFIVTKRIIIMEVSLSRLNPGIFHENKIFYETSSYRINLIKTSISLSGLKTSISLSGLKR